jgi:diaminopimelate epimerase
MSKSIPFYKLHGAGNDILVVESKHLPKANKPKFIQRFSSRKLGIGADQVMEVEKRFPLRFTVWNTDGSKAEMCANGSRVLLFLSELEKWHKKSQKKIQFQIGKNSFFGLKKANGEFEISLGIPRVEEHIIFSGSKKFPLTKVNVGNPHAVIFAKDLGDFDFRELGKEVENHSEFPQKTNVEFIRSWKAAGTKVEALVDVWERGAGATLSCGSGAVAVATVLKKISGKTRFSIHMNQFVLEVRFEGGEAFLSGPSALVAKGEFFS